MPTVHRRQVTFGDVEDLARARRFGGSERLQQLYQWHAERLTVVTKGVAGAVVSLLTAILVAFLTAEVHPRIPTAVAVLFAAGVILSSSYAAYAMWRLSRLPSEYAASLRLYETISRKTPGFPAKPWS